MQYSQRLKYHNMTSTDAAFDGPPGVFTLFRSISQALLYTKNNGEKSPTLSSDLSISEIKEQPIPPVMVSNSSILILLFYFVSTCELIDIFRML